MGIRVEKVNYYYDDYKVLSNINLEVYTGETIGIIGPSGGGKSTLLKLLSGLYSTQSGIIEVEGESVTNQIRKKVAVVMQNAMLFPASIRDNITCGHYISEDILNEACDVAKITDWINSLPDGMNTFVGERGSKVSGGQAQRISIARAIAKQAPVILYDEATSALDENTSIEVWSALNRLTVGKTVISVTHRPETLVSCKRIYRLEGGLLNVT